jgi:hypothetical protein
LLQQDTERRRPVRFELGQVLITPAVCIALAESDVTPQELLARHQTGDFGNLYAEDRQSNRRAAGYLPGG